MLKPFISFVLCISIYFSFSQTPSHDISCLTTYLKELKSISPDDADFSDLEFLREILKDVEIVTLGEATHGDGTTFKAKIRLVKFLHEELGFDVLAFESGLYDCNKAWELIEQGEKADTTAAKAVFGIWSMSEQVQPLFRYLEKEKRENQPLIMAGFDFQFSGSPSGSASEDFLIKDLKAFLNRMNIHLVNTEGWIAFAEDIQARAEYRSETGQVALDYLEKIENELNKLETSREISFWLQWIKSTKALITDRDNRDKYMAENLIWLKENYYPGEKIICWGASIHFLFNSNQLNIKVFERNYYPPMGEYLKQRYGDKLYAIAATAFEGESGWAFQEQPDKIYPAKKNSLEYLINQHCSTENCFIDFREIDNDCFLKSQKIKSRVFRWYKRVRISQLVDGLIFHKVMQKSILIEN